MTFISPMKPLLISAGEGKSVNVIGNALNIRVRGRDTGGVLSIVECVDLPGGGPPPHIHHREDETFQVIEGEYEFTCGGKTFTARKGATIFAPRGVPHSYRYVGNEPGSLMMTLTPAGFEDFFEEVGALTPEQQQIPRVIEIATKYGLEFLPPPSA
jgi:quercetin dioxygenase-like cupin family protein